VRRLLVLYSESTGKRRCAEGLICVDGAIYVRGFEPDPSSPNCLFGDLHHLKCWLRDNVDIRYARVQILDEEVAE
jgi:hypothetical protein